MKHIPMEEGEVFTRYLDEPPNGIYEDWEVTEVETHRLGYAVVRLELHIQAPRWPDGTLTSRDTRPSRNPQP